MRKPIVAIVGRPNVGKSTFVNRLIGTRNSIVHDLPGVTRDRIYFDVEWQNKIFTVIDTGGIIPGDEDEIMLSIFDQAKIACEEADKIIFLVDGKEGVNPVDFDIANILRQSGKPVYLAVNKLDNPESYLMVNDFYSLALGEPIGISALHGSGGVGDLLDIITKDFDENSDIKDDDTTIRIAIVGRPNAGKSSIVNSLLNENRVIVSDISGTTRDSIDSKITYKDREFVLVDTAGIRKKSSVDEGVEQYSVIRSLAAIRRADIVIVVIDAKAGISEQDVKICGYVHEQGKPSVIVMNKWDAVEKDAYTVNTFNKKLEGELKFMSYFVPMYVSAKTGQRVEKLLATAMEVYAEASKRVATGVLNDIIREAVLANEPPTFNGKKLKIYYVTQASTNPPVFVFFVNDDKLLNFSYKRYLNNALRNAFTFRGTPIKLEMRSKDSKDYEM